MRLGVCYSRWQVNSNTTSNSNSRSAILDMIIRYSIDHRSMLLSAMSQHQSCIYEARCLVREGHCCDISEYAACFTTASSAATSVDFNNDPCIILSSVPQVNVVLKRAELGDTSLLGFDFLLLEQQASDRVIDDAIRHDDGTVNTRHALLTTTCQAI